MEIECHKNLLSLSIIYFYFLLRYPLISPLGTIEHRFLPEFEERMTNRVSFENNFKAIPFAGMLISDYLQRVDMNGYLIDLILSKENIEYIGRPVLDIISTKDHPDFLDLKKNIEKQT